MHVIDRRLNPKSKSLGNRQRFVRRAKAEIREAVREALKGRKVTDIDAGEKVRIRSKSVREPAFGFGSKTGKRAFVVPGNKKFRVGDTIPKPPPGGGGRGQEGSPDGSGEDDFVFTLTRDEFLSVFFEDLALPNLVKAKLKAVRTNQRSRAGYTTDGSPSKLNRVQTMRNSLARRLALRRPGAAEIAQRESELAEAEARGDAEAAERARREVARLRLRQRRVAFIDPLDLRFNRFETQPKPATQAVMFCLMDASASMTEELKDLAKRFFMLLYLFLTRHYEAVEVVFIRHTSVAAEVDEETFFRGVETGGTVVSTAFDEMLRVVAERYPVADWNIYAAQASDGHNFQDDMARCVGLLDERLLGICQYFAYIEVADEPEDRAAYASALWRGYRGLGNKHKHFAMKRVRSPAEIYPVFHELFSRTSAAA